MKRKTKRILWAALALVIVLGALGIYPLRALYIKNIGITLTPSTDFALQTPPFFLQHDAAWGTDKMGVSGSSMGAAGCLVTCCAGAISELGIPVTPGELNRLLSEHGGYTAGGELIWTEIGQAVPGVSYTYSRVFSAATLERDLQNGRLPIVQVQLGVGGPPHWLLVVGARDGEFLVHDPLNRDKEPTPLSRYGRVYAYRVLTDNG